MSKRAILINKKGEKSYRIVSIRLKEETLNYIDKIAKDSNRSRNEIVNILLENSVDNVEVS